MKLVDVTPDAANLIESLRDLGYQLETAVADLIDNSISAGATEVDVFSEFSGDTPLFGILDNGAGMSRDVLFDAMRPGTRNPLVKRDSRDLGRFGLGLKTASFSQSRRMTVVTKSEGTTSIARWDLDRVSRTNRWEIEVPDSTDGIPWVDRIGRKGTLVIWEKLDRIGDGANDAEIYRAINRKIEQLAGHLALVFHRFLSGERGLKRIEIRINGLRVEPYDPFGTEFECTIAEPPAPEPMKVGDSIVHFQTFTLPHHSKISAAEWEKLGGQDGFLRNQGFYVYRGKRLIIHGTWFGLARQREITKLTRVKVDIPNELDIEWRIDVRKNTAQLPHQVRDRLRRIVETITGTSAKIYVRRGTRLTDDSVFPIWIREKAAGRISYRANPEFPLLAKFSNSLSAEKKTEFEHILKVIEGSFPFDSVFADLGSDPNSVGSPELSNEDVRNIAVNLVSILQSEGVSTTDIAKELKSLVILRSNWHVVESILEKMGDD